MLVKRITTQDAQQNILEVLGTVHTTKEAVIVEKEGEPFAVVVSPEEYQQLQQQKERGFAAIHRIQERNADKDPEEVFRDVTTVVEAVRQERYERSKQHP